MDEICLAMRFRTPVTSAAQERIVSRLTSMLRERLPQAVIRVETKDGSIWIILWALVSKATWRLLRRLGKRAEDKMVTALEQKLSDRLFGPPSAGPGGPASEPAKRLPAGPSASSDEIHLEEDIRPVLRVLRVIEEEVGGPPWQFAASQWIRKSGEILICDFEEKRAITHRTDEREQLESLLKSFVLGEPFNP